MRYSYCCISPLNTAVSRCVDKESAARACMLTYADSLSTHLESAARASQVALWFFFLAHQKRGGERKKTQNCCIQVR